MYGNISAAQQLHRVNCYYFESMLRLIIILWMISWLYAWNH